MTDVKDDPDAAGVDPMVVLQNQNARLRVDLHKCQAELRKWQGLHAQLRQQHEETVEKLQTAEESLREFTRDECDAALREDQARIQFEGLQAKYAQLEATNKRLTAMNLTMQEEALRFQEECHKEYAEKLRNDVSASKRDLHLRVNDLEQELFRLKHATNTDNQLHQGAQKCEKAAISEEQWMRREDQLTATCQKLQQQVADLSRERDEADLRAGTAALFHQGAEQAFKDRDEFQRQNARLVQSSLDVKKQLKQSQQELHDTKNIIAHQQQQLQKLQQLCEDMRQYKSTRCKAFQTPISQALAEVEKMRFKLNDLQEERAMQQEQQQQADRQNLHGQLEHALQDLENRMQKHATFVVRTHHLRRFRRAVQAWRAQCKQMTLQSWRAQCKQMTLQRMDSLVDFQHRRAHQLRFLLQWRETKRVQAREQRDLSQYNEGWRAGGQVAQERAYKQGHWDGFKDAYQENCLHINAAVLAMNYAAANMGPRPFT